MKNEYCIPVLDIISPDEGPVGIYIKFFPVLILPFSSIVISTFSSVVEIELQVLILGGMIFLFSVHQVKNIERKNIAILWKKYVVIRKFIIFYTHTVKHEKTYSYIACYRD